MRQSRIKILLLDCFYKFDYHHHAVLLLMDLKVKAKQYILCSQYFVLGKRSRLKICVILGLNLINLRRTVPNTPAYSHALFRAWEYSLLISILLLLPHILAPYRSQYPLYSIVSSLDSHINYPRALLHIPSTPLYRLCTPIYPRTFYISPLLPCIVVVLPYIPVPFYISPLLPCIVFVLPYIPVPFYISPLLPCIVFVLPYTPVHLYIYTLFSLVSSLYSHIFPYPSTSTLYFPVSSL